MVNQIYDVLILGGGPAGYTAAMYCARAGLDALVTERLLPGGQAAQADWIDNVPGFDQGIGGMELGERMRRAAERFGAQTLNAEAIGVQLEGPVKQVETTAGPVRARTVILATGASPRTLDLPRERALLGRGVSYCPSCDGPLYRGRTVAVVGGGNAAVSDATTLSRLCSRVILVHRRDQLRAELAVQRPLMSRDNVTFLWNSAVEALLGDDRLTGLRVRNALSGGVEEVPCDGLFISIGRIPETGLFKDQLPCTDGGEILSADTRTPLPGVYAAGDVRAHTLHQIVTAAADGATAAHWAQRYLEK